MTVATQSAVASFSWTGAGTFAAGFPAQDVSHVAVISQDPASFAQTLLTQGVHYSVSLAAGTNLVTVTPIALPLNPATIIVYRTTPGLQAIDFANLGDFAPAIYTALHDAAALRSDEASRDFARALLVPLGEAFASRIPAATARANKVLGFDAIGNPQIYVPSAAFPDVFNFTASAHQNQGGVQGHNVLFADQNATITADHLSVYSLDQSLVRYFDIGGSATAGNVVTITFQLSLIAYPVTYTVQAGDTLSAIAAGLAAGINGGTTHSTGGPALVAAMLAWHGTDGQGYVPQASALATRIVMDFPWASAGNTITTSVSGGATCTIAAEANTNCDNGPYLGLARNIPGRTPVSGDQYGSLQYTFASGPSTGLDSLALINLQYLGGGVGTAKSRLLIGATNGAIGPNIALNVGPGGVALSDTDGSGNPANCFAANSYGDPGAGSLTVPGQAFFGMHGQTGFDVTKCAGIETLGVLRVLGHSTVPSALKGLELGYNDPFAQILAFDRDAVAYKQTQLIQSTLGILPSGSTVNQTIVDAAGVWPNTDNTISLGKVAQRWAMGYFTALTLSTALAVSMGGTGATALGATLSNAGATLQTIAHTGDVTTAANSFVTTVAKIAGTTVSGTTGTGNVVFSASPTHTGQVTFANGSVGTPAFSLGDATTGAYRPALNSYAIATAGVLAFYVNASQQVGIGTSSIDTVLKINANAAAPPAIMTGLSGVHLIGTDGVQPGYCLDTFGTSSTNIFRRANGTNAVPTQLVATNVIGSLSFQGRDDAGYSGTTAQVRGVAGEPWTSATHLTSVEFGTTASGATVTSVKFKMWGSGGLQAGVTNIATDPGAGTIAADTAYKVGTTQVLAARITGYTAMTGSPDKATAYATSTVTLAQLAGRVAQIQADLTTHGVIGA